MANTFKSAIQQSIGTSIVAAYTVPAATQATAIGIVLANTSASSITGSVLLTVSGTQVYLVKDATIPVGSSLTLDQKIALATGNVISFKSSAATSADGTVSVLEIT